MLSRRLLCTLAVALTTAVVVTATAPPISVDTRVRIALRAPADFHIRISVEPHAANRTVCLHADLDGMPDVQKGCWNAGALTTWRWLKGLDTGDWDIYATVERNDNTTMRSLPLRLVVRGPGYEEPAEPF